MSFRHLSVAAALIMIPAAASAQSVQAVVQVGSQVQPVTVSQSSGQNFVGVIQIGTAPRATISQTGAFNFAGVGQAGVLTQSMITQTGQVNSAFLGQIGLANFSSVRQMRP